MTQEEKRFTKTETADKLALLNEAGLFIIYSGALYSRILKRNDIHDENYPNIPEEDAQIIEETIIEYCNEHLSREHLNIAEQEVQKKYIDKYGKL